MVVYDEAGRQLPKTPDRFPTRPRVPSRDPIHFLSSSPASGNRGATFPLWSRMNALDWAPEDGCSPLGRPPERPALQNPDLRWPCYRKAAGA